MTRRNYFGTIGLLLLFWASSLNGMTLGEGAWEITADRMIHQQRPNILVGEGNVILREREGGDRGVILNADWLRYDSALEKVEAKGNITMERGGEILHGAAMLFDLYGQRGSIQDGELYLPRHNLHFFGKAMEKTGDAEYFLRKGVVTACLVIEGEAPAWSLAAAEGEITLDEDVVLRHATFRVKDVPVLYTPYFYFPLLAHRQSGFLFPEFSQSRRDGTGVMTPLFIDLSPSSDITLYPGYLSRRGVVTGVEWRYALAENSSGWWSLTHLDDDLGETAGDEYKGDGYVRTKRHRYWFRGKADHSFPEDLIAKLDVDLLSDRDFLQEYRKGIIGFDKSNEVYTAGFNRGFQEESIPFRESRFQVTKGWSSMFAGAELLAIRDVWDEPVDSSPLQALPRLRFDGRINPYLDDLGVELSWESEYVNYWRRRGIGEHRLDVHPRMTAQLPFGRLLEGTLTFGLRETIYQIEGYGDASPWPHDAFKVRTLWNGETDVALPLTRAYPFHLGPVQGLTHLVRPKVGYHFTPDKDQDDIPYLDDLDRIIRKNWVQYGIDNFFTLYGDHGDGNGFLRKGGYLKVNQALDVREWRREMGPGDSRRPFSDILVELKAVPGERILVTYETAVSVHGRGVTHYDLESIYMARWGGNFGVRYRFNRHPEAREPYFFVEEPAESIHELNASLAGSFSEAFSFRGSLSRSLTEDRTIESTMALLYAPSCWSLELLASETSDDFRLGVIVSLSGLGKMVDLGLTAF